MLSALLGLLGSVVYGGSDFFGGLAAGRMHAEKVTAINSLVGVALLSLAALVFGADFSRGAVLWGAVAGAAGVFALVLLYACLAIGPMSILAPIMALVSAIVPIAIALGRGDHLSPVGFLGLAVGLVAVVLICFVPGAKVVRPTIRAILMATGAGVAIGLYLFFLDLAPFESGLAPLVLVFAVSAPLAWGAVLVRRIVRGSSPAAPVEPWWRGGVALAVYSAVTDAVASTLLLLALRLGSLAVVSVLSALSPAGTILLAALVLKERVAVVQWIGLAVALVAAALLALA
jgi:drug/metabolite transporter (DMT)-like permease